jgi:hypothetical protein
MSANIESSQISVTAFNRLKLPVLSSVLEHYREPEVIYAQIWRIIWVEKAFKLRVRALCGNFAILGIVHMNTNDLH